MLTSPNLATLPHIAHGFFGRTGGVSEGIYASLNCGYGSGDDVEKVRANRLRVSQALGATQEVITCFQVHGNRVVSILDSGLRRNDEESDALVTNQPNLPIGILTADCLPVLFADAHKPIIGAAHAGWKGAMGGVLEATLQAMKDLGAHDIIAAVGPAIAQSSYEVGAEFYARFMAESEQNKVFFIDSSKDSHYRFDLKAYAKMRLQKAGISSINILEHDTCLQENDFFSYRRATLRDEKSYGRQVAAISMMSDD